MSPLAPCEDVPRSRAISRWRLPGATILFGDTPASSRRYLSEAGRTWRMRRRIAAGGAAQGDLGNRGRWCRLRWRIGIPRSYSWAPNAGAGRVVPEFHELEHESFEFSSALSTRFVDGSRLRWSICARTWERLPCGRGRHLFGDIGLRRIWRVRPLHADFANAHNRCDLRNPVAPWNTTSAAGRGSFRRRNLHHARSSPRSSIRSMVRRSAWG